MKVLHLNIIALILLLISIDAYAQPNANFNVPSKTEGCASFQVQFNCDPSTVTGYTHDWDFGNGVVTNGPPNPSRIYTSPGVYSVKHTVSGSNGTASITKTNLITVHPTPSVSFSGSPLTGCPPLVVNFTDNSTPGTTGTTTYQWVFGNGSTPATLTGTNTQARNPSVTYNVSGTNNVTLKVTNSKGCEHSLTKQLYVTVLERPVVDFSANKTDFCSAPGTATFTPTVSGNAPGPYTYSWDFGPAGTSTSTSPTVTFNGPAPAQYIVKLTVTSSNGCATTVTKNGYIKIHKPNAAFTGPSSTCLYATTTFTNTSVITSTASFTWMFGDNTPSVNSTNGAHEYTAPGTYTVKLITSEGGCLDSTTRQILVRPQPNPKIVKTPDSLCPAPQTMAFSTDPAMTAYNWNINHASGMTTSASATPTQLYTANGHFPVILKVTDQYGCKDTIFDMVSLYPLSIASTVNELKSDSGCAPFTAKFKTTLYRDSGIVYPYPVLSYKWKFGDGDSSSAASPTHIYTDTGRFKVYVEVITKNGCPIKDSLYVVVGNKPVIHEIVASSTVICPKKNVDFVATVTGPKPARYIWDFGDGPPSITIDDSTMSHIYSCVGKYTVKLVVMHNGCASAAKIKNAFIEVLPPCAKIEADVNCIKPLEVKFFNQSIGDSSRVWMFGDGNTSTQMHPTHTYAIKGNYWVTLAVYNSTTNCHDTARMKIFMGENPPDMTANKLNLCKDDSVTFKAFLTGDSSTAKFDWYINGTKVATNKPIYTHTFYTPGVYSVRVISEDDKYECLDTITKTNWITVGGPTAAFNAQETNLCLPGLGKYTDVSFAGSGTSLSYRWWNFTGGGVADTLTTTGTNTQYTYTVRGDYDVKLVVTDNLGCKDSIYKSAYMHILKPVAGYLVVSPVCVGTDVPFTNTSTNAFKFSWTFGDGGIDTVNSDPMHKYATIGIFNTQLIVTDTLGCKDTTAQIPVSTTKPIASFTASDSMSVCPPLIVYFDGTGSTRQRTYNWDFDDGTSAGFKSTNTVVYNAVKEYRVRLIVRDSIGCEDTAYKTVQVLGYAGAFDYTPIEGCAPLTVNFSSKVKGSVPTMIWDFGDGNTMLGSQQQLNVTYTYTKPGMYLPRMIFNNNIGCNIGSDGLDTIMVDGAIADFEPGPACQFSQVEFINKSQGVLSSLNSTNWLFHDGSFSALANPKRYYGPPGKYMVKLNVKNVRGCVDSIEKEITINVPIEVNAGADTIICLTDSVMLYPSGGVSYLWSPGNSLSCTNCNNPYAFPKVKTIYEVISTDINGCHDTGKVEVALKTHVQSTVGKGGEICDGESITLNVTGARTYAWSPSHTVDSSNSGTPSASPRETTKYRVIAYEGKCIPDTNYVDVTVHPRPTVSIRGEQTIVAGTSADLLASGENILRFLWTPSNTLSCAECADPAASPFKTTVYQVKVTSKFGCVDSSDVTITVLCDKSQLFIPNTFTPNGDGMNDIFMVRGNGVTTLKSFRVYNRLGQIMFEKNNATVNDKANGWDGSFNGVQLPPDVYVYTVEAYCDNGDLLKVKGDVTIIR